MKSDFDIQLKESHLTFFALNYYCLLYDER